MFHAFAVPAMTEKFSMHVHFKQRNWLACAGRIIRQRWHTHYANAGDGLIFSGDLRSVMTDLGYADAEHYAMGISGISLSKLAGPIVARERR